MNRKTAMKLFGLLGLLMLLSCGYADRHRNNSSCEQVLVDSLEVRVQDSLFSNVHYSRSQVLDALIQAQDSRSIIVCLPFMGKHSLSLPILILYSITTAGKGIFPQCFPISPISPME